MLERQLWLQKVGTHRTADANFSNALSWAQSIEKEGGALHRLFRIEEWPSYSLFDKDGVILSNSFKPGEPLVRELEKQFERN